jgi:ABC-2 type transport system permease protein
MKTLRKLSAVELKLLLRDPLTVLFSLALPIVVLFVLGGVFGNQPNPRTWAGVGAMSFYVPAYVALVIASVGMVSIPTHLAGNRERGVLKRLHASGVPAWAVMGSQVVVVFVLSTVSAIALLLAASLAYEFVMPASYLGVLAAFLLIVLMFATIGVLLGAVLPTARAAQAVGVLLWFVVLLLGGAGPPYEVMGKGMQTVADWTPLRHAVRVIQDPWLGTDAAHSWPIVLGILLVASLLALRFFRWE